MGPSFPLSLVTLLDPLRKQLLPIDVERVMKMAERFTGLHDYGDADGSFRTRLEETIAVVRQTDWNTLGRFGVRYILHWHLSNRLRLVELLEQRPDIEQIEIERPIVITGLFRTGTTYLHNVLAADPSNRGARMWELAHPVGRRRDLLGDEKWRRWRGGHEVTMNDIMIPEQAEAHHVTLDAYEEDFFLLENDMVVMKLFVGLGNFDYARTMLDWDMLQPYRWHKRQLQILWEQRSAARWLLKCPWHLWNLQALLAVYPDARVIQTHRGMSQAIGSQCSLSGRIASKFQRRLDLHELGRFWLEYSRTGIERGLRARDALPASQIYDVRLADLHARPLEIIEDIYRQFQLPLDDVLRDRLRARIAEEPKAQQGEHDYDIADYGLNEAQIEAEFADYRQRFDI
ncbi:MAG TPA: sulfotransferase [Polyangiales bacterium]|nr:sulfotransferase [Polyangiales bacterium]